MMTSRGFVPEEAKPLKVPGKALTGPESVAFVFGSHVRPSRNCIYNEGRANGAHACQRPWDGMTYVAHEANVARGGFRNIREKHSLKTHALHFRSPQLLLNGESRNG